MAGEAVGEIGQAVRGGERLDFAVHDLGDGDMRECVGIVVLRDAQAAAGDFFGHDGVLHEEARDEEREGGACENGQHAIWLERGLEGENHAGEQRARCAGKHRRHADQRGDAEIEAAERGEPEDECADEAALRCRRRW